MTTYILGAKRTPVGKFNGAFATVSAPRLGAEAIKGALIQAKVNSEDVEDVIMGNVLAAGIGQAPARQAALYAGLPHSARSVTINKVCGSGLYSVITLHNQIRLSETNLGIAGGQENMTLAPHLLEKSRSGYRLGHGELTDSIIKDGLWDPYDNVHMGNCAELCAEKYQFSKSMQDEFALESYKRAQRATQEGILKNEIVAVSVKTRKEQILVEKDEEPFSVPLEKLSQLKPAFMKDGTVTAGNASSLNDGGAALVLASEAYVNSHQLAPLAKIVDYTIFAHEPKWFTTAPAFSMAGLLEKNKLKPNDIDLYEINEAFSVVTMAAMKELSLPSDVVNIYGGAVSIGHPIGASGARILVTLLNALHTQNKQRGIASICIGGGEAASILVEMC